MAAAAVLRPALSSHCEWYCTVMYCTLSALFYSYIKNHCSTLSSDAPLQEHNEGGSREGAEVEGRREGGRMRGAREGEMFIFYHVEACIPVKWKL